MQLSICCPPPPQQQPDPPAPERWSVPHWWAETQDVALTISVPKIVFSVNHLILIDRLYLWVRTKCSRLAIIDKVVSHVYISLDHYWQNRFQISSDTWPWGNFLDL